MRGAAPRTRRSGADLALAVLLALACAGAAGSALSTNSALKLPAVIWAVELDAATAATFTRADANRVRRGGVNVLLVDAGSSAKARARLRRLAAASGLTFVAHAPAAPGARVVSSAAATRCRAVRAAGSRFCALRASGPAAAKRLARTTAADLVVVRLSGPGALRFLRGKHATRVLAVAALSGSSFNRTAWQRAVSIARAERQVDLAVRPSTRAVRTKLNSYLALLRTTTVSAVTPDAGAPGTPSGLVVASLTRNSASLGWQPVAGAAEYGVYVGGALVGRSLVSSFTAGGLACGTAHAFAVDAVSATGARSARAEVSATTAACGGGGASATAPAPPAGLVPSGPTATTITLTWQASTSTDVVSYGLYRGGAYTGSASSTTTMFTGLACGTAYALGVDAVNAAGLRSSRATVNAATAACAPGAPVDTTPPSVPAALQITASSGTSVTISWNPSTDNTAVTGYTMFRNGASVGTTSPAAYTYTGLACGTTYTLGVEAFDAAGNRSSRASIGAATSSCTPPADTTPPSVPQGMAFAGTLETSVSLVWLAATDNVGVAGYRLFRNGTAVATVTTLGYTYGGLACGTSYTFALEAFDAAGNASNRAQATGTTSTASCGGGGGTPPPPPPPPPPTPTPSPPPAGTDAHLGVDTNGGSCTRSPSRSAYADATACGSLNAAYQAAANGDTVLVRGGSYGSQVLAEKSAAASPGVLIATTSGETVSYSRVEFKGSFVQLLGPFRTNGLEVDGSGNSASNRPVEEVVVSGFEVDGQGVNGSPIGYLRGADRVTWQDGTIHSNRNMSLVLADQEAAAGGVNNITFDRVTFHDALLDAGSSAHTECLYAQGIGNLRITNSHFYRCAVMDVFITRWTGTSIDAVGGYVENNIFEAPLSAGNTCCAGNAFHFRDGGEPAPDIDNWDFRYNVFAAALSFGGNENVVEGGGLRVVGNVFLGSSACKSGATYAYNVHGDGSACGGSGEVASSSATIRLGYAGYVGSTASNNNWQLTATSLLIDKGHPGSYPSSDRAGRSRPSGGAPDAGPYEHG